MKKTSKKEFVCEQDRVMAAFAKVNIREAVDPIFRGKIVDDEEAYNKVQQLLDCPDMEHAHQFLLDVDFEDLTPETKQKIDDLYQLAVSQGYLDNEVENKEEEEADEEDADFADSEEELADDLSDNSGGFETVDVPDPADAASKDPIGMNAPTIKSCAFVLFYSAMKNGEIRTGECYSNANTLENAKLDAIQKLEKLGFTAVDIIAAEECDCSAKGCDEQGQMAEFGAQINEPAPTGKEDVEIEQVGEAEQDKEADNVEKEDEPEEKEADGEEEKEDEEENEEKELSRTEKLDFFKSYLEEFKKLLQKMKSETYSEMSLADRAKFYDQMTKIWAGKPDPAKFMTPDNVKQIETMKIKLNK